MVTDILKEGLLRDLAVRIDAEASVQDRQPLHCLSSALFQRLPPEDLRGREADTLYGCLHDLLHHLRSWQGGEPKIGIFNPAIEERGWESNATVLLVLCPGLPFSMDSVRGELNRRGLSIHTLASCNLAVTRDADGELTGVVAAEKEEQFSAPTEGLLYFEIRRHSNLADLDELRTELISILAEVSVVVSDFPAMCDRLQIAANSVMDSACISRDRRDEAVDFLRWLERNHMTFLGYEYLEVDTTQSTVSVRVRESDSLGSLRHRSSRGVDDLMADLERLSLDQLHQKQLSFSKSRHRSRVHRAAYPDYVEVRVYDEEGQVVGQHRFLGLYTAPVYSMDPQLIPILRRKVSGVIEASDLDWSEHERRELIRVLQMFPRDELFQSSIAELCATANTVNSIQERRQTRLFIRRDVHGKFVNCILYVPRDRYNSERRMRIQDILTSAFAAQDLEFNAYFSESVLVRCHFVLRVDPARKLEFDAAALETQIVQAVLGWEDRLRLRLVEEFGEETGERYCQEYGAGFAAGYRDDFEPRMAVQDLKQIQLLQNGKRLAINLYHRVDEPADTLRLRLYHPEHSLPLSDVLPILENLGLRVIYERPYALRGKQGAVFWIQEFTLVYALSQSIVVREVKAEFEDAFSRIWFGEAENDSFNRLLLGTRFNWRDIALLRAYARYLRQLQFPFSVEYMAETLADHLTITSAIVEMFGVRFSPGNGLTEQAREDGQESLEQEIIDALELVPNLGQDRIFRQFARAVKATLRTNFYQAASDGSDKEYFSFKFDTAAIPDVPQPVPMFEIYVYSPRIEGVHLRGGKVARGGLRWSDRMEDFRTEVLGLVKAQQVKNAVIVPVGAKGGFVARRLSPEMSAEETRQEGIACYQLFIRGLLDITDNRVGAEVVCPPDVIAKDEPDPYLVVAADKGTATFSDIANDIAGQYDFWLGDAFASGGSVGYDHKKMGITARGAWVSVQRHFREMGLDVQASNFTALAIGDMAGDVFGNGMLQSRHIQLVAAFNHRHIFLDPDPQVEASYEERLRLFNSVNGGWDQYDSALISAGGGVFERASKSIELSKEVRERFAIEAERLPPSELISHLLMAPVDLLWNGGIGTYVKASDETHLDVGDKSNDGLRVDGAQLRCRVVGEGGNLGLTQRARVEYCLAGGRCNTDFIDNAGGVDCSDHEVNIKILLDDIVHRGELTRKQRNDLLEGMTDSVAALVLKNNYRQAQSISLVEHQAVERAAEYQQFIHAHEQSGRLDRALEFLPTDEELLARKANGETLTRPELSVLVSYSKAALKEELGEAGLDSDPYLSRAARGAFPAELVDQYPEAIGAHRLHRELVATQIANDIVNRMGLNFVLRQQKATGATVPDIARAYAAVLEIYQLPRLWDEIEALDNTVPSSVQVDMMLNLIRLVKRATRWLLRNRRGQHEPGDIISQFSRGLEQLRDSYLETLQGQTLKQFEGLFNHYLDAGVNKTLATAVASAHDKYTALGIIAAAEETDSPLLEVAHLYFHMGERLELDWFSEQIMTARVESEWQALARDTYLEDLQWQQRTLAVGALRHMCQDRDLEKCLVAWEQEEAQLLDRWRSMLTELHTVESPDFAMLAVANRELLDLAQSSTRKLAEPGA